MNLYKRSKRRVVVTGIGMMTPLGVNVNNSWQEILQYKSGISKIQSFDTSNLPVKIAGEIPAFEAKDYISPKSLKSMSKFIQYGMIAAGEAIEDSGIRNMSNQMRNNIGVIVGSGLGGIEMIEQNCDFKHTQLLHNQYKVQKINTTNASHVDATKSSKINSVSPFFIPSFLNNMLSSHISIKYGFYGVNYSPSASCVTGSNAVGQAYQLISDGHSKCIICGSSEAPITPLIISGFASAKALSTKFNDTPQTASRPWDRDRSGFVLSEGAGILVLEEYEQAEKRNAKIYGEVRGYSSSSDGYHITSPNPDCKIAVRTILKALSLAQINPGEIDYINAHATSTIVGDLIEYNLISHLLEKTNSFNQSKRILVSSTKSSIGHTLGASGAIEAIFTVLSLYYNIIPPTLNLDNIDPQITNQKIHIASDKIAVEDKKFKYALSTSFGFGGLNSALVFGKL